MIVYISTKSTKSTYFFKICKNEEFIYFNKIYITKGFIAVKSLRRFEERVADPSENL